GSTAFAPLARFGKYDIIARLGQGGMASVYLAVARDAIEDVRKLVVLKILHESFRDQHEYLEMFVREARISVDLSHPNVVHTYNVGEEDGRYCIVMEYLEGVPLSELLKAAKDWTLEERLPLLGAMCIVLGGLHYVHDFRDIDGNPLDLVHRDLKPANILIGFDGQTKLLDFGVAKVTAPQLDQTEGLTVKGTVQYVAPEALDPAMPVDRRYDVFAAGLVLYEIATGRRLWANHDPLQILRALGTGAIDNILDEGPELPPALDMTIRRALRADPDGRQATALQLKREVQGFLVSEDFRIDTDQIAALVVKEFGDKRANRRATISKSLKGLRAKKAASEPPRPDTSMEAIDRLVDELDESGGRVTSSETNTVVPLAASSQTAKYGMDNRDTPATPSSPPPSRRGLALAALLIPLVIAGGYFATRGSGPTPTPAPAPAPKSAAVAPQPRAPSAAPTPPATAETPASDIEVTIAARPADAEVFVDGVKRDGNPVVLRTADATDTHEVRVRAAEHAEESLEVQMDRTRTINVELPALVTEAEASPSDKRRRKRPRRAAAAEPPPPEQPPPANAETPRAPRPGDELPTPKKRPPKSSIDSKIPWNE
ncbi:MAG: serine/threonine-protein kinase, partial [Myxococcota bacterium]